MSGCSILKNKKLLKIGSFDEELFKTELPFKLINNFIVIEAEIDNGKYNFILDTGAEVSVISLEVVSDLGLKKESSIEVFDSGEESSIINMYVVDQIKFNTTSYSELLCLGVNFKVFQDLFKCDIPIHGLIGNRLMRKAAWKIDYKNKIITLWKNKEEIIQPPNSSIVEFEKTTSGNGEINVKMYNSNKKFTFDTGFNGFIKADLSFAQNFASEKKEGAYAKGVSTTVSLHGSQTSEQLKQKIPTLSIGGTIVKNEIVEFEEKSSYLIGNIFWKNYIVTIDWKNSLLYLENTGKNNPHSFESFQYEIDYDIPNKTLSIKDYWTSHSLYQPIDANNKIVSIEGLQINKEIKFCDFLNVSLPKLLKKDKLLIEIIENGKLKSILLKKELLIE